MQWIIAIELLAVIIVLLGLVGTMNDFIKAMKPPVASIDDGKEPKFIPTPVNKPNRKRAMKQTTTLRKNR